MNKCQKMASNKLYHGLTLYAYLRKGTVAFQTIIRCHMIGCGCYASSFIWVSDKLKCVYFEIPKAGSSSIKRNLINDKNNKFYMFFGSGEQALKKFSNYFKFTVLRDPYSRLESNYRMFCLSDIPYRRKQIERLFKKKRHEIDFENFLQLAKTYRNHHWEQQVKFLPKGETYGMDKIAKLSSLENDWEQIKKKLDISTCLIQEKVTTHLSSSDRKCTSISELTKGFIEEEYKDDFEAHSRTN